MQTKTLSTISVTALTVLFSVSFLLSLCFIICPVDAADDITVYVTVSDGSLVLAGEAISVSDKDSDGRVTFNDAMILAHDKNYDGGSAAGYGYADGEYGIYMTRLWGTDNGGSYGYYLNNRPAPSLDAALNNGDSLYAYVITDTLAYSDLYCYFDVERINVTTGEYRDFTLKSAGYDNNWSVVIKSVGNASLTVNGITTGVTTDTNGTARLTFTEAGTYIISATSNVMTIVPPICVVTVAPEASNGLSGVPLVILIVSVAIAVCAVICVCVILIIKKRK